MATPVDEQTTSQTEATYDHLLDQTVDEVFAAMLGSTITLSE
jgi:hypothetical protein